MNRTHEFSVLIELVTVFSDTRFDVSVQKTNEAFQVLTKPVMCLGSSTFQPHSERDGRWRQVSEETSRAAAELRLGFIRSECRNSILKVKFSANCSLVLWLQKVKEFWSFQPRISTRIAGKHAPQVFLVMNRLNETVTSTETQFALTGNYLILGLRLRRLYMKRTLVFDRSNNITAIEEVAGWSAGLIELFQQVNEGHGWTEEWLLLLILPRNIIGKHLEALGVTSPAPVRISFRYFLTVSPYDRERWASENVTAAGSVARCDAHHADGGLSCGCVAAGDVLRGDDDAAGRLRDADGLPAEQLQGAAAAVHGSGVLLLHRRRGAPHTRYQHHLSLLVSVCCHTRRKHETSKEELYISKNRVVHYWEKV